MGEIVMARTRWEYQSYSDYHRLVELSGLKQCFVDEIDPDSDNVYIFTPANGEVLNGWPSPHKAKIIHWQLEPALEGVNNSPPGVSEVWTSDSAFAKRIGARFVLLGSHAGLNLEPEIDCPKTSDVVLLQYLTYRRQVIRNELLRAGVVIGPDGWNGQRHSSLQRTRILLHIHQHDNNPTLAPLRLCIGAAYHLPVLSETLEATTSVPPCMQSDYGALVDAVRVLRHNDQTLAHFGAALYQALCIDNQFKTCVERAV